MVLMKTAFFRDAVGENRPQSMEGTPRCRMLSGLCRACNRTRQGGRRERPLTVHTPSTRHALRIGFVSLSEINR